MAYLARIEAAEVQPLAFTAAPARIVERPGFSALEWSIIRLAQIDRLWTIRPLGLLRRAWNWLSGRGNPALANERLEALRRISVLSWHFGYTIGGDDLADFLSAGFTTDQYELLVNSVRSAAAGDGWRAAPGQFA